MIESINGVAQLAEPAGSTVTGAALQVLEILLALTLCSIALAMVFWLISAPPPPRRRTTPRPAGYRSADRLRPYGQVANKGRCARTSQEPMLVCVSSYDEYGTCEQLQGELL